MWHPVYKQQLTSLIEEWVTWVRTCSKVIVF